MLVFSTCNHFLFGLENILVIFFGAGAVLDTTFSIGMLMAFLSYKTQFSQRVSGLVDEWFEVKMLKLHGARLADIVLTKPERSEPDEAAYVDEIVPSIRTRNLRFRYSDDEPYVLNDVNVTIDAGESVAIVGPSGCGKTTLIKVLLGIHPPTSGNVLVGGVAIKNLGLSNYRRMIGTVMQEDQLFAGSVADNICFFSLTPDRQFIQACAKQAALHEEIMAMPMGYNTLIGDMGDSAVRWTEAAALLARLYRKPKILFLDEHQSSRRE
jgi:ATP-binding cassette subfamily B protein RaxB